MHSLPTRVKPFQVLSQGEQERFLVATTLKEGARGNWDEFEQFFWGGVWPCIAKKSWLMLVDVDISWLHVWIDFTNEGTRWAPNGFGQH
jgi:hypothetical protein